MGVGLLPANLEKSVFIAFRFSLVCLRLSGGPVPGKCPVASWVANQFIATRLIMKRIFKSDRLAQKWFNGPAGGAMERREWGEDGGKTRDFPPRRKIPTKSCLLLLTHLGVVSQHDDTWDDDGDSEVDEHQDLITELKLRKHA